METLSSGSSDSPRADNNDIMSVNSDSTFTAARESLLADYVLMDEDASLDYSGRHLNRQASAIYETNVSMHYNPFKGKSLSFESLATSSGYASPKSHHKHHKRKQDHPVLQVKTSSPLPLPKSKRIPDINIVDFSSRSTSSRSNIFVKHLFKRAKSVECSGTSSPIGEDKPLQRRLLSNLRLEIHWSFEISSFPHVY